MRKKNRLYVIVLLLSFSCAPDKHQSDGFNSNFELIKPGTPSDRSIKAIWPGAKLICGKKDFIFYKAGLTGNYNAIIETNANRYLQVTIPKNQFGPIVGSQWKIPLSPSDEYIFSYDIKFDKDFDFVKGGKLPGMAGGKANTGGSIPNGYDGWSARMMFWDEGKLSFYLYFPEQSSKYGERYYFQNKMGDTIRVTRGKWHSVKQYIKLNTPDKKNGIIKGWLNGEELVKADSIMFRNDADIKIDQILFNVFMGGGDAAWAPGKDESIAFDNLSVKSPTK